jgi:serine/threonine protein kinase
MIELIDETNQFSVFKCERITDQQVFSCRMINSNMREKIKAEITLMHLHKESEYNVNFVEAFDFDGFLYIITEYMDCGPLTALIISSKLQYPEKMI